MSIPITAQQFKDRTKVDANGCWIWTGALKPCRRKTHKYGWVAHKGTQMAAHRLSWIFFRGEIPDGAVVCHKCDVPACVNPDHLFVGTQKDNVNDMYKKGRREKVMPTRRSDGLHISAKVTKPQIEEMKRMYGTGLSQDKIARIFNISQSCVSLSIRGVTSNAK